jgi:hypothetical protein
MKEYSLFMIEINGLGLAETARSQNANYNVHKVERTPKREVVYRMTAASTINRLDWTGLHSIRPTMTVLSARAARLWVRQMGKWGNHARKTDLPNDKELHPRHNK